MLVGVAYLILGVVMLYGGAESLVRGSASMAYRLGVSRLVIGLTVVAFGTSSPEWAVSVQTAWEGNGALAIGNVVGSNICNIGLILGLAAWCTPLAVHINLVRLQIPLMILVSRILLGLLADHALGRSEGALLFAGLAAYVVYNVVVSRKIQSASPTGEWIEKTPMGVPGRLWKDAAGAVVGVALLVGGANLFVSGAVSIGSGMGWPPSVLALGLVAMGTSLPELATSLVAARRGETDLAVGNIVGSNIFNMLGILGTAARVRPMTSPGIDLPDLLFMTLLSLLLLPLARSGYTLKRWEGVLLLVLYSGYVWTLVR